MALSKSFLSKRCFRSSVYWFWEKASHILFSLSVFTLQNKWPSWVCMIFASCKYFRIFTSLKLLLVVSEKFFHHFSKLQMVVLSRFLWLDWGHTRNEFAAGSLEEQKNISSSFFLYSFVYHMLGTTFIRGLCVCVFVCDFRNALHLLQITVKVLSQQGFAIFPWLVFHVCVSVHF